MNFASTLLRRLSSGNPGCAVLLTFLFGLLASTAQAQQPAFDYAVANGPVDESHNRVAIDSQGNTYVTGYFHDATHFGAFSLLTPGITDIDIYVAKFDPAGQCVWARQLGTPTNDSGTDVAVDAADNVYLTGNLGSGTAHFGTFSVISPPTGSSFVAKLDGAGRWRWVRQGAGIHAGPNAIALDTQGGVYVAGTFSGPSAVFGTTILPNPTWTTSQEIRNVFVAKLDSAGVWKWANSGGPTGSAFDNMAEGYDVAADSRGNVLVTGAFAYTVQFGATTLTSAGNTDVLVAQLNATTGAWQWARRAGGPDEDAGLSLAADATGHACVTGTFYSPGARFGSLTVSPSAGMADVFITRLDAHGNFQWVSTGGGTEEDTGTAIVMDGSGAAYVAGEYRDVPVQFGPFLLPHIGSGIVDLFVAKLDSLGNYAWAVNGASRGNDHVDGLALAGPADDVVLSGWFESDSAHFGLNTLAGDSNRWNHYIARLSAGPALLQTVVPASGASGQVVALSGKHLGNVTAVLFNGVPAPAFTIRSTSALRATVPAGAGTGSITVRTAGGLSTPGPTFQVQGLATTGPIAAADLQLWPNPVESGTALHLHLPEALPGSGPTQLAVRNALGQLVRQEQFSGRSASISVQNLGPGVYQLVLARAGQVAVRRRIVID